MKINCRHSLFLPFTNCENRLVFEKIDFTPADADTAGKKVEVGKGELSSMNYEDEAEQMSKMYKDKAKPSLKEQIYFNKDLLRSDDMSELIRCSDSGSYEDKFKLAQNIKIPSILMRLSQDEDLRVRAKVAENRNTPSEALMILSQDKVNYVQLMVAANPNTPSEAFMYLSRVGDWNIRRVVAGNPNTPSEVLTYLSLDESDERFDVIYNVAGNPNTPSEVLTYLSKEKHEFIRSSVAGNPNTPSEVVTRLSKDADTAIRRIVAENPGVIKRQMLSRNEEKPYSPLAVLTRHMAIQDSVARNPNTPSEVLTRLSKYADTDIRQALAEEPEVLTFLSKLLARNPNTPSEVLTRLSKDEDTEIQEAAASNLERKLKK